MLAAAFIVSSALTIMQAKRNNINPETIFNLLFIVFVSGIIGARIFYVTENAGYYIKNPSEIIMLQRGGLSWFGGLVLAVTAGSIYLKRKKLSVYKVFDLIAPFIALAQAIGRIGCLLNGCCFGEVSDFGLYFPVHQSILIPTQLYSSLLLILIFVVLRFLQERPHKEGEIFIFYLLFYCAKRFFIEFWRADNEHIYLGLSLFQIISIAIFILAAAKLFLIRKKS